jgi:hypothetical protein
MFSPLLKVPYGVDVVDRVEHKTSGQKFKLLWFGPTYPWYNPEKLLDVLPQLENTTIDFVSIKHPRYGGSYNKFFKKFFDACSSYTNINIVEEYCDDPVELYSHYDAGIILARDWLEEKYSTRCRTLDMLTHGLPVIMNKGNSFFNELFFLRDGLYPITTKSIKRDLMHLEKNRATVKISEENRISLQKKLSWSVVSEELINYILKF